MIAYWAKRLGDVARAAAMRATLRARERWSREQLESFQRERLSEIVAHARRHSPFYREL